MKTLTLTLTALLLGVAPCVVSGQTVQATPLSANLPKACWPASLLTGKDTAYFYLPCNSLEVLDPYTRAGVDCTLGKLTKGGWPPRPYETYRSDRRQRTLYGQGRTRPGLRVTNASSAISTVHFYGMAVDIIHATKGWDHPRFFYWVGQHAETCGLVAGAFWAKFKDLPHVQAGVWQGAPPAWAKRMAQRDSAFYVWRFAYNVRVLDNK